MTVQTAETECPADLEQRVKRLGEALADHRLDDAVSLARDLLRDLRPLTRTGLPCLPAVAKAYAYYVLGHVANVRARPIEATSLLESAVHTVPAEMMERLGVPALHELATLYADMDAFQDAADAYRRILAWQGLPEQQRGRANYLCGTVLERAKDYAGAAEHYATAIQYAGRPEKRSTQPWAPQAHAGAVRCAEARETSQAGFSFAWWFSGSAVRWLAFTAFASSAAVFFGAGVFFAWSQTYEAAKWWLIIAGFPIGILVLPGVRRVSLKDGTLGAVGDAARAVDPVVTLRT